MKTTLVELSSGPLVLYEMGNDLYATRMLTPSEIEEVTWVAPLQWVNDHFRVVNADLG